MVKTHGAKQTVAERACNCFIVLPGNLIKPASGCPPLPPPPPLPHWDSALKTSSAVRRERLVTAAGLQRTESSGAGRRHNRNISGVRNTQKKKQPLNKTWRHQEVAHLKKGKQQSEKRKTRNTITIKQEKQKCWWLRRLMDLKKNGELMSWKAQNQSRAEWE